MLTGDSAEAAMGAAGRRVRSPMVTPPRRSVGFALAAMLVAAHTERCHPIGDTTRMAPLTTAAASATAVAAQGG